MSRGPAIFTPEYYARLRALEAHGWWNAAMRDILAAALSRADLPASGLVLDVGCGSGGTMAWFLRDRPAWRWAGVDVAWDGLRALPSLPRGGGACASALALPVRDGCVDLAIAHDVLQHLPLDGGDVAALREVRRVLRRGGLLFLRTNAQAFPRGDEDPEYNFRRYRTGDLRRTLAAAGFTILALGRVNALLGLAEIPREWRARRSNRRGYQGVLAPPPAGLTAAGRIKRRWLAFEGRLALAGWALPGGRTHVALCRARDEG